MCTVYDRLKAGSKLMVGPVDMLDHGTLIKKYMPGVELLPGPSLTTPTHLVE